MKRKVTAKKKNHDVLFVRTWNKSHQEIFLSEKTVSSRYFKKKNQTNKWIRGIHFKWKAKSVR